MRRAKCKLGTCGLRKNNKHDTQMNDEKSCRRVIDTWSPVVAASPGIDHEDYRPLGASA
jgi:hypothetical protein